MAKAYLKNNFFFKLVIFTMAISPTIGASIANAAPSLAEGVAAIVNDDPITSFDVKQRVRYLLARQNIAQPTDEIIVQAAQTALDNLINERLQLQEAKKFKLNVSDAEVDAVLTNRVKANGGTLADFFKDLQSAGLSVNSYRDSIRAEIAWQRIVVGRYGSRVKIPKSRVREVMAQFQASADKTQYSVSEIYIETPSPAEEAQTFKGAQTIVQKIRGGESFKALAEVYSYAPSAATGGNIGWVVPGVLRPEVAAIVDKIEIGQVSDPIKVQGGYMIIGVAGKHQAKNIAVSYALKQVTKTLPANADQSAISKAQSQLSSFKASFRSGCDGVEKAGKSAGFIANNLGSVAEADLSPEMAAALAKLGRDQATDPQRTKSGVSITYMCEKTISGEDIPTPDQIEDNMREQELNLIARRYLRDLRREAAIVRR